MFVLSIITLIIAIAVLGAGLFFWSRKPRTIHHQGTYRQDAYDEEVSSKVLGRWLTLGGVLGVLLGGLFLIFSSYYTQEAGEAKVLRDWTGNIVGSEVESGGHWKDPWVDTVDWDIRNQSVMFAGKDGTTTHNGQEVQGAQISFTDRDGVSGNLDIQVIYSIKADEVEKLTYDYTGQEDFKIKVVENDVKSIPRDVISQYTTIRVFNERSELRAEVESAIAEAWADKGVTVESVNIQGIRYPKGVNARFEEAQNAQTELLKAETEAKTAQTKAEGEAQAEIAKANGEAEANRLLSASLTPQVLQQRWIDAITSAQTIIVPQDFTSLGNLNGGE